LAGWWARLKRIAEEVVLRAEVGDALEPIAIVEEVDTTGAVAMELREAAEDLLRNERPPECETGDIEL
jgi:hypothetical protein